MGNNPRDIPDEYPAGIPDGNKVNTMFLEMTAAAEALARCKRDFVAAGFTEDQAFDLVKAMLVEGMRPTP